MVVTMAILSSEAFTIPSSSRAALVASTLPRLAAKKAPTPFSNKITVERRKKLGIPDNEDEYDLEMALNNNTDPFITKVIAGSLIVSIMSLLVYAIIIPATTDYGNACNPLLTGGRC
jgi:hypothetical protein